MNNFIKLLSINLLLICASGFAQDTKSNKVKDSVQSKVHIDSLATQQPVQDSVTTNKSYTENLKLKKRKFRIRRNSKMRNRVHSDTVDEVKRAFQAEKRMQEKNSLKKDSTKQ